MRRSHVLIHANDLIRGVERAGYPKVNGAYKIKERVTNRQITAINS